MVGLRAVRKSRIRIAAFSMNNHNKRSVGPAARARASCVLRTRLHDGTHVRAALTWGMTPTALRYATERRRRRANASSPTRPAAESANVDGSGTTLFEITTSLVVIGGGDPKGAVVSRYVPAVNVGALVAPVKSCGPAVLKSREPELKKSKPPPKFVVYAVNCPVAPSVVAP